MYAGPERRRGRRHASFDVVVENHGNSPMEIVIAAQDAEARCPVSIGHERTMVPSARPRRRSCGSACRAR